MTGMRSLYFWRGEEGQLDGVEGVGGMEGVTHDAFGLSLALLEGVLVLKLRSHDD